MDFALFHVSVFYAVLLDVKVLSEFRLTVSSASISAHINSSSTAKGDIELFALSYLSFIG